MHYVVNFVFFFKESIWKSNYLNTIYTHIGIKLCYELLPFICVQIIFVM